MRREDRRRHWPSKGGIFPDKRLWEIFRMIRFIRLTMFGIGPVR